MAHRTYEHVAISQLKNHPLNIEIFGELRPKDVLHDSEFVDSVKDIGILEPVLLTVNKEIIAGHRRRQAAARAGLKEVPCLILRDLGNDRIRINRAWFEANRQREMNTEEKARWGKARLEIEEAEAKQRQKSTSAAAPRNDKGQVQPVSVNLLSPEKPAENCKSGKAMEIVAEEVGMSESTLRKAIEVTEAIDAAKEKGQEKKAEELRETLNGQSVAAAHRLAVPPKKNPAKKSKPGKPKNPAKLVDSLTRTHYSALVKGIDAVAALNGGKGAWWEKATTAMDNFAKALKEMREGKQ